MPRGLWTGMAEATKTIADTGMKLMELDQSNRYAKIAEENNERARVRFENEQKKIAAEEAEDNEWVPASMVTKNLNNFPSVKKQALDYFNENGFEIKESGGDVYFQKKALKSFIKGLATNDQLRTAFTTGSIKDMESTIAGLSQQKMELVNSGKSDDKTKAAIQQIDKQIESTKAIIAQNIGALAKQEKKYKATSWGIADETTGKPSYVTPKATSGGTGGGGSNAQNRLIEETTTKYKRLLDKKPNDKGLRSYVDYINRHDPEYNYKWMGVGRQAQWVRVPKGQQQEDPLGIR
jgi:hypothetical protein